MSKGGGRGSGAAAAAVGVALAVSVAGLPLVSMAGVPTSLDIPKVLPSGESHAAYLDRQRASLAALTRGQREAIENFTGNTYSDVRRAEHAMATGVPVHDRYRLESNRINAGLRAATPEPGTVYRGISGLSAGDVERMVRNTGTFRMGLNNTPATTSATWHTGTAVERFLKGSSGYDVLMKIHHKSGVGVEPLSHGEGEVLLPKGATFRVVSAARWAGRERTIVLELQEI